MCVFFNPSPQIKNFPQIFAYNFWTPPKSKYLLSFGCVLLNYVSLTITFNKCLKCYRSSQKFKNPFLMGISHEYLYNLLHILYQGECGEPTNEYATLNRYILVEKEDNS